MKQEKLASTINSIFWPIVISMLITSTLAVIDGIMISRYDNAAVAGVQSISAFSQAIGPMFWAVVVGIGVFSAQYAGAKDYEGLRKTFGLQIVSAIVFGFIGFLIMSFFASNIVELFISESSNQDSFNYALDYAKYFRLNYLVYPINLVFTYQYRYAKRTRLALYVSTGLVLSNTILNYFLIPVLGAGGASLATFLSNLIFILVNVVVSRTLKMNFIEKLTDVFNFDKVLIKKVVKVALPIIISEAFFGIGRYAYSFAYAHASIQAFTVDKVAFQLMQLPNAFVMASANTISVIIGNYLGAGKSEDEMKKAGNSMFKFMALISVSVFVVSFVILPYVAKLYGIVSGDAYNQTVFYIRINGVYLAFRAFSSAILFLIRAGGDVKFGLYTDILTTWFIGIPIVLLGAFYFDVSENMLKVLQLSDIISKTAFMLYRYKKYYWLKKVV